MSALPSLSALSLAARAKDDDGLLSAAPVGAGPSAPIKDTNGIMLTQALIADRANKQAVNTVAFVWDSVACPASPRDAVETIAAAPLPQNLIVDFDATPRNMAAFWYKACGAVRPTHTLGTASEAVGYQEDLNAWTRARALYTRQPPRGPDPGPRPTPPPARTRANDWEYYAFPVDMNWIKLPLFNPWHLNTGRHKNGFHDIVLYADSHPDNGAGAFDFSVPAEYPHQHGFPYNHQGHDGHRPYYTPYSREDAAELYYHDPARQHTRFDTEEERPDPNNNLPIWNPSVEHIVPKNRFPKGPVMPANGVFPMLVPAGPAIPPGLAIPRPMRYAYGPNDPNGWMLERNATNALRDNDELLFYDDARLPGSSGDGWLVPASERGRVARKWLYMMATYKPMEGEFLAPSARRAGSDYAVSLTQSARAEDILDAARTPIHPDELAADRLMRATYGWGNPLLTPKWQAYFLGPARNQHTAASGAFHDIVFRRPAQAGNRGGGRGRGRGRW